jgi:hypothetical protein
MVDGSHQVLQESRMPTVIVAKTLAVWLGILILAVANGMFREAVLIPTLGKTPALILSGTLLSLVILAAAYLSLPWLAVRSPSQLLLIGLGWLVLTLIFEFSFGLLRGVPLTEMLAAYTFRGGNIWPVVLLVTAAAPWLAARLRGWL